MKRYMKLKNLAISTLVAIIYYMFLVDGLKIVEQVTGVLCMFLLIYIATSNFDKIMIEEARKRREQANENK